MISDKSQQLCFCISNYYFAVHNFTLQSIILFYSPQFYFAVYNFALQSIYLLFSPQFYFTVHNFDLQSIYCKHVVRNCYFTVHMCANFYFTVYNTTLQSTNLLCSPQYFFTVHNFIYSPQF